MQTSHILDTIKKEKYENELNTKLHNIYIIVSKINAWITD